MNINVKAGEFEGPFELLLHLIDKNKINIKDIPITQLTNEYLEYLENYKNKNMEQMSDFILMASTLLEIKSKMLLPLKEKDENNEDIDPRQALVEKLIEYKRAKKIAELLKESYSDVFYTSNPKWDIINELNIKTIPEVSEILEDTQIEMLYKIFNNVLSRKESSVDKVRSSFDTVKKDEFTVHDKMDFIFSLLINKNEINFTSIFSDDYNKNEIVASFLAILELVKINKIFLIQHENFDEILITKGDFYE